MRTATGWWGTVLEAPDPAALGRFYAALFDWPISSEEPDWVTIGVPGTTRYLAFQRAENFQPPVWPARPGQQHMTMHVDIGVSDLADAVAEAEALGARLAQHQPQQSVRVMLDPAGHPFCLYLDT